MKIKIRLQNVWLTALMIIFFGITPESLRAIQSQKYTSKTYEVSAADLRGMFYKAELKKVISIDVNKEPVEEVLRKVARKTGLKLTYRGDIMSNKSVTLKRNEISVTDALTYILKDTGLDYKFSQDGYLLINRVEKGFNTSATVQEEVVGRVTDAATGEPLPGVNIVVKNTNTGTSTDADGRFELTVPSINDTLIVSFIGYQRLEEPINGRTEINIELFRDTEMLEDVVVVGYGMQQQERVTGSISSVRAEDLGNQPVSDLSHALQGKAAGVEVVRNGGAPGVEGKIRIRGTGTVNNADPLVVIDGVPTSTASLSHLSSDDIESVDVLKDASSAAIYGNRAANGVILVTTKRGNFNSDLRVSFSSSVGVSRPIGKIDVLDAPSLAVLKRERYDNDGLPQNPIWHVDSLLVQRTDWQDELLGTGFVQDYNLSIQGGSENSSYYVAGSYMDEEGMMESSWFDRYGLKINTNHRIGEIFTIRQNLTLARTSGNTLNTLSAQNGVLWSAIRFYPGFPVKWDDGSYSSSQIHGEFGDINNPIFTVEEDSDEEIKRNRIFGNVAGELELFEGLSIRSNFALDYTARNDYSFDIVIDKQIRARNQNMLVRTQEESYSILSELIANYNTTLGNQGNHSIEALGGIVLEKSQIDIFSASRTDFSDESESQRVLSAGDTIDDATGTKFDDTLLSYLGRLNYSFADKYLLSTSYRIDGSSNFASENRWGHFPAISVGWRISEESFFQDMTSYINNLRLTAGWGRSGNQSVDRLQYIGLYAPEARYSFGGSPGGTPIIGTNQVRIPNPDISWETVETLNFGLHASLLEDRINATVEYFVRDTEDMLLAPPTIAMQGTAEVPDVNVGGMRNNGLELELSYEGNVGNINFRVAGNAAFIKNEVTNLNAEFLGSRTYGRPQQELARTFVGHPIATFYGWRTDGLYQTQGEIDSDPNIANDPRRVDIKPGDVRFLDLNGDGIIDSDDRTIIGDPNPDATYGINIFAGYNNFNLSLFFAGVAGVDIFNGDRMQGLDPNYPFNMYAEAENRWRGEGTSNTVPRMTTLRTNLNHRASDKWIERGDFLRLKTMTLGYTLPTELISRIGLRGLRVYITGNNVFTITPYSGIDPELGYSDGNLQRNVDFAQYPQARSWIVGTSIDF